MHNEYKEELRTKELPNIFRDDREICYKGVTMDLVEMTEFSEKEHLLKVREASECHTEEIIMRDMTEPLKITMRDFVPPGLSEVNDIFQYFKLLHIP